MRLRGALRRVLQPGRMILGGALTRRREKHVKIDDEERNPTAWPRRRAGVVCRPVPSLAAAAAAAAAVVVLLLCLGCLLGGLVYRPPWLVLRYLQWRFPAVRFHFPLPSPPPPPPRKLLALTLDDAPSAHTPAILDLLRAHGARATFFVIGNQIAHHPHLLQRIQDEGHEIGIHGWADEPSYRLPLGELEAQIVRMEGLLPFSSSPRKKWFRPGSGWFTSSMIEKLQAMGYEIALGSIYPHDPQIPYPALNAAHVLSRVRAGGIIIMHDRRSYSAQQVKLVLDGLTSGGWKVRTLSEVHGVMENPKNDLT